MQITITWLSKHTKSTESRAAKASISAHETTPGQEASICDFA